MARKLEHLDGARTVLALWIALHHWPYPKVPLQGDRAHFGVSYFIVLSGFVTHWVYGRPERWDGRLLHFYARRFDRIVLTSWLGMSAYLVLELSAIVIHSAAVDGILGVPNATASDVLMPERLLGCFSWLRWYYAGSTFGGLVACPDVPTWTVGALILCWLLYPLMRWITVQASSRGSAGVVTACLVLASCWVIIIGAQVAFWAVHGFTFATARPHDVAYYSPPAWIGEFSLGVVAAVFLHNAEANEGTTTEATPLLGSGTALQSSPQQRLAAWVRASWAAVMADVAAITVAATVVFLPTSKAEFYDRTDDSHRTGPEALLDHALAPLFAAWIYGSSAGSEVGLVGRLLQKPPFAWSGKYSFHTYILWDPLRLFIRIWWTSLDLGRPADAVTALLILWIGSAVYAEYVEGPLVQLLRCDACAKPATTQPNQPPPPPKSAPESG